MPDIEQTGFPIRLLPEPGPELRGDINLNSGMVAQAYLFTHFKEAPVLLIDDVLQRALLLPLPRNPHGALRLWPLWPESTRHPRDIRGSGHNRPSIAWTATQEDEDH